MKSYYLLVILFSIGITLISCGKENLIIAQSACDLSSGTDELAWLDDMVANIIENNNKFEYNMMSQFEGEIVLLSQL